MKYISINDIIDILDKNKISKSKLAMGINVPLPAIHRGLSKKTDIGLSTYYKILTYLIENNLLAKESGEVKITDLKVVTNKSVIVESEDMYINLINKLTNENIKLTELVITLTDQICEAK